MAPTRAACQARSSGLECLCTRQGVGILRRGAAAGLAHRSPGGGAMTQLDLVIRGGEIVTAGGSARADVGVADGLVAQIGGEMGAAREIDATGKLLLPGGVDAHVHLSTPSRAADGPRWVDDFTSGSAAALAGGVTTVGN